MATENLTVHLKAGLVSEHPLGKEYRDTSDLRADGEVGVYVDRQQTGVSRNKEVLNAEDVLDSTAVILVNKGAGLSYLAIVNDSLTGEQSQKMEELTQGEYDLVVIVGKGSRQTTDVVTNQRSSFMEAFHSGSGKRIGLTKSLDVDYGGRGWCIAFDPKTRIVKVYTKSDETVREYKI